MTHVLLVTAAETSKVPFYICGSVLAAWAVLLAGIGLSRPEFPNHVRGQRGVIAISFVLIVLAIGTGIATS